MLKKRERRMRRWIFNDFNFVYCIGRAGNWENSSMISIAQFTIIQSKAASNVDKFQPRDFQILDRKRTVGLIFVR